MSEIADDEAAVVCAFLQRVLEDRFEKRDVPLEDYLPDYPGYETAITREFERLTREAGGGAAAGSDQIDRFQPILTLGGADRLARSLARRSEEVATRYRIDGEVGRGGMGVVLRVWDRELRRTLAMKVLSGLASETATSQTWSRFLEEAQITGQLQHPGIVPVHEVGFDGAGRPYFTMPLLRGRDFREIIGLVDTGEDGWTLGQAVDVVQRVCDAVAFAHSRQVLHRDLKPANVMVGRFGEVHVMDWGLARLLGSNVEADRERIRKRPSITSVQSLRKDVAESDPDSPLITKDGDVVGTPAYMAPEQARGEVDRIDIRTDVFGIGAILYHLLAGRRPYASETPRASRAVLASVIAGPPARISELRADRPKELIAICEKAMEREPADRYPTVQALADDLRAFRELRVVGAYEAGAFAQARKWVQRNRALAVMSAMVLLALLVGVIAAVVALAR